MRRHSSAPSISRKQLLILLALVAWALSCSRGSGPHSVTLSWQASSGTTARYNVYRRADKPASSYVKIASRVSEPRFEDLVVRSGATYCYAVTVLDQSGRESRFSNVAKVEVP